MSVTMGDSFKWWSDTRQIALVVEIVLGRLKDWLRHP